MRRNPFDELEELFDRVGRQVEEGMGAGGGLPVPGSIAVDVADADGEYVVTADLPGYDTDEIELTLSEGRLRIEAEREESTDVEEDVHDGQYLRQERRRRSVSRRIRLPEPVEDEAVSATYSNGVLTVTLPKEEGDEETRTIDIE